MGHWKEGDGSWAVPPPCNCVLGLWGETGERSFGLISRIGRDDGDASPPPRFSMSAKGGRGARAETSFFSLYHAFFSSEKCRKVGYIYATQKRFFLQRLTHGDRKT